MATVEQPSALPASARTGGGRIQLLCAYSGVAALVLATAGWLIAGVLPFPLGASSTPQEVVRFYSEGREQVLAGLIIASIGVGLVLPMVAAIAAQMLRMEGRTPILTFVQLASGAATGVLLVMPMLIMAAAGFRPDRDPEITVMLNDLAWLLFLTPIAPFIIQNVAIGLAVIRDPRQTFPRWVGYANFWIAFLFVPDVLAFIFKTGPFAWQGIFVFWLALSAYAAWLLLMPWAIRRALLEQNRAP
jgi:hypothetical protein